MDKWVGKVAVITGASSGIGEAIARSLVKQGVNVVGLSRRDERMEAISTELKKSGMKGIFKPIKCDVTREQDIKTAFGVVEKSMGAPHIVINNAAITDSMMLTDPDVKKFRQIYETNVFGLITVTKEAVSLMKTHKIDDAIIININSVAGHLPEMCFGFSPYASTKAATLALTRSLRNELIIQGANIRVTNISPGAVKTEMLSSATNSMNVKDLPALEAIDIADCVLFILSRPSLVNITEIIVEDKRECVMELFNKLASASKKG